MLCCLARRGLLLNEPKHLQMSALTFNSTGCMWELVAGCSQASFPWKYDMPSLVQTGCNQLVSIKRLILTNWFHTEDRLQKGIHSQTSATLYVDIQSRMFKLLYTFKLHYNLLLAKMSCYDC